VEHNAQGTPPHHGFSWSVTHFTLHCYRMDAWAIRRPWLTFVKALANSILGRFYTARTQRFASCAWPRGGSRGGGDWGDRPP